MQSKNTRTDSWISNLMADEKDFSSDPYTLERSAEKSSLLD